MKTETLLVVLGLGGLAFWILNRTQKQSELTDPVSIGNADENVFTTTATTPGAIKPAAGDQAQLPAGMIQQLATTPAGDIPDASIVTPNPMSKYTLFVITRAACSNCKTFKNSVLTNAQVVARLGLGTKTTVQEIDYDKQVTARVALIKACGVKGSFTLPYIALKSGDGALVKHADGKGISTDASKFLAWLPTLP